MADAGRDLVGRDRDLVGLERSVAEAARGHGGLVVVTGEAGIGKTRLCEELVADARTRGASVAWTTCWESGGFPAFWPWSQLLAQIGGSLPLPSGDADVPRADSDEARAALYEEIVDVVRAAGADEPRVLVIDDVQWADEASLRLLRYISPLLRATAVLVVVARRIDPGAPWSSRVDEIEQHARVLRLGGLAVDHMRSLIERATGDAVDASIVGAVHDATAGNPLFALELVGQLKDENRLDALARGDRIAVPQTIVAVQTVRLDRVDDRCRDMLAIASVIGDECDVALLGQVSGTERPELLELLGSACDAGVLREFRPGRYGFMHPLLRATAYDGLGVARRVQLHEQIGLALESARQQGAQVEASALARHFLAASAGGGADRAVRYAVEAGDRAMAVLAYEDAATCYEQALSVVDAAPAAGDRISLLLSIASARAASGLPSRSALLAAADQARAEARPHDLASAALGLARGGGFEVELFDHEQIALLEEALSLLGGDEPALRGLCSARLSVALSLTEADERRVALSAEAVELARRSGDQRVLAHALAASCDVYAGPADTARRIRDGKEIVAIGRRTRDVTAELLGRRLRLVALLEDGDIAGVDGEITLFAKIADELHQPAHRWYVPLWLAMRAGMRGDVDASLRFADQAAAIGAAAGSPNVEILVFALRFFLLRDAGEAAAASALFDAILPNDLVAEQPTMLAGATAFAYLGRGRFDAAVAVLDRVADDLPSAPIDSEWLPLMAQLAEVAFDVGGHPIAAWLYDQLAPFERSWVVEGIGAYTHGSTARFAGLLAVVLGRPDDAVRHFEVALHANFSAGASLLAARTQRDWGVALDDRARLADALDAYRRLGVAGRIEELEARVGPRATHVAQDEPAGVELVVRREGDLWSLQYGERVARVRHSKGMGDLAHLIDNPGREIAAVDLAMGGTGRAVRPPEGFAPQGDLGPVIDATAKTAYQARLRQLEIELDAADAAGDTAASARLVDERDALVQQLAGAFGLGGRPRRTGDPAERARTAVTARIRDAIRRIEKVHPDLARHLTRSVRTGAFCVYDP